jgi:glycosyltransferase involved in cell wall biosynthesis
MVTVAVPTYERPGQLRRAIESVLSQDYEPIELIISDNGSTDGTQKLCQDYVDRIPSVRYVRHSVNVGPTLNFEGLRLLARGAYFLFLGDDDWIDSGYVSACVTSIEANPGTSLQAGRAIYHGSDGAHTDHHPVNISDADARRRVLAYCRQVRANGIFYGVTPVAVERCVPALRNVMGCDIVHVMALAYLGPVRTLDEVALHRTIAGTSVNLANVAAVLGVGWFQANAPQVAIAYWVFRDIAFDSPLYSELGRWGRLCLGARAGAIVFLRFVPRATLKFARLQGSALICQLRAAPAAKARAR